MPGLVFKAWQCYNTATGQSIVTNANAQQLQAGQAVTCVAEYELAPSPSPGVPPPASPSPPPQLPSPSPPAQASPSPSPGVPPPASPTPSPSPAPGLAQLALLTKLPAGYPSPGADLNATSPGNDQCLKPSSPVEGRNSTSITSPGAGQCGNGVNPGTYTLGESPMPGLVFKAWQCYNTATGQSIVTNANAQQLQAGQAVTCVAEYELAPSPSPGVPPPASPSPPPQLPSPSPPAQASPSPSPGVPPPASPTPSPSPAPGLAQLALLTKLPAGYPSPGADLNAPQPCYIIDPAPGLAQLALLTKLPAGYPSPGADLNATSPGNDQCLKPSSPVEGRNSASITSPGAGQCGNGVNPGTYTLGESPMPGLVFKAWQCYN
eukprot:jgi/Sobl393_1/1589/SZX60399.1